MYAKLPVVGQGSATTFPPPLWGRDRERGTTALLLVQIYDSASPTKCNWPYCRVGRASRFSASWPSPSLSPPHKGGGNDAASTFAPHTMRPCVQRCSCFRGDDTEIYRSALLSARCQSKAPAFRAGARSTKL